MALETEKQERWGWANKTSGCSQKTSKMKKLKFNLLTTSWALGMILIIFMLRQLKVRKDRRQAMEEDAKPPRVESENEKKKLLALVKLQKITGMMMMT